MYMIKNYEEYFKNCHLNINFIVEFIKIMNCSKN